MGSRLSHARLLHQGGRTELWLPRYALLATRRLAKRHAQRKPSCLLGAQGWTRRVLCKEEAWMLHKLRVGVAFLGRGTSLRHWMRRQLCRMWRCVVKEVA